MNYEIIADRDKGDDPQWVDIEIGDRYLVEMTEAPPDPIVRIERPVPTIDVPEDDPQDLRTQVANLVPLSMLDGRDPRANVFEVADEIIPVVLASVHPPTREQIIETMRAVVDAEGPIDFEQSNRAAGAAAVEAAVLALIQNGDDR